MSLFQYQEDPSINHLPYDGIVHYWGNILSPNQCDDYFERLLTELEWQQDEAIMFGKHIITRRKIAWYADAPYEYTYSKIHRKARIWNSLVRELKTLVETHTGAHYNACLLNLYPDGESGMGWHRDDEKDLLHHGSIASLSFGATRKFVLKHKQQKEKREFQLAAGDLLEMKGETQDAWLHNLPTTKRINEPRINLTFRQMVK